MDFRETDHNTLLSSINPELTSSTSVGSYVRCIVDQKTDNRRSQGVACRDSVVGRRPVAEVLVDEHQPLYMREGDCFRGDAKCRSVCTFGEEALAPEPDGRGLDAGEVGREGDSI